jgi:hypothetical protein
MGRGAAAARRAVELQEALDLIRRYVVQETVAPFRALARAVALGALGALFLGVGAVLLLVGLLRALEEETGSFFAGTWSWGPYAATAAVGALACAGVIWALVRPSTADRREGLVREARR